MDPASATVAFVGFAASLASIAAVVVDSSKTLYNVCKSLKDAPSDIQRLYRKVKRLEEVVLKMGTAANDFCDASVRFSLEQYWSTHAMELEDDLNLFKVKIMALHTAPEKKSQFKLNGMARIRKFFSEEEIQNAQTKSLLEGLRAQSDKLDDLVSSTNLLHGSIQRGMGEAHKFVRANADSISSTITQSFREIRDGAHTNRNILPFGSLQQIRITEDSLRIEHIKHQISSQSIVDRVIMPPTFSNRGSRDPRKAESVNAVDAYIPPFHTSRPRNNLLTTKILYKISVYQLPIGILTVQGKENVNISDGPLRRKDHSQFSVDFALFPASWIAKRMVHFSFGVGTSVDGTFTIPWGFKQAIYSGDPTLLECLQKGDLDGLQRLFGEGRARATDLLAPWGNSLLHEAVFGFTSGNPKSYQICEFLLNEGADPNLRNSTGRAPLLLSSRLMNETTRIELQAIASLLICRGADLAICDPKGYSILGGLARTFLTFQACLESHLREYRTPPAISSYLAPHIEYIKEFDVRQQVIEVKQADAVVRTGFLRALCAKGTLPMVKPFLESGIDLDELDDRDSFSYVRAAAKAGNTTVVSALLQAGASMNSNTSYNLTAVLSPVDEFLERWYSFRIGRPEYYGNPEAEYWILQELLLNPTFRGPNVLLLALHTHQPPFIFRQLLDAGCGRRRGNPPASWELKRLGSEVIVAVTENNPILLRFLDYDLALDCEDRLGFTALLHALDRGKGSLDFTKVLIDAGADLVQRTGSGYTPLEFAAKNLRAKHPRSSTQWRHAQRSWELRTVTEEEDREAYERLMKAIKERNLAETKAWFRSERSPTLKSVIRK